MRVGPALELVDAAGDGAPPDGAGESFDGYALGVGAAYGDWGGGPWEYAGEGAENGAGEP